MTDGEGAITHSGLFHKYFMEHNITYIPSRGHPVFAEIKIRTFRDMLDKRVNTDQQWTELIYPIILTVKTKLVHSETEFMPSDATRQESNEFMTNI